MSSLEKINLKSLSTNTVKLSVIIVNYNVRHFLEQSIRAAIKAIENVQAEIIVVDNTSSDGSKEMMAKEFPDLNYIYLHENVGFSRANNIGIKESKGEYVLLLNPDTVVAEDAIKKSLDYLDNHLNVGGMGVHMIDGTGHFLPESKRGLPTPQAAFYKIFGLSRLFPKSKIAGKYHLGFLDPDTIHEVDVLSGAFMMMRRDALEKSGLLDEAFFMYGEDIDLSYRLIKAGYKNIYFPEARIIHYKGESTKKGSVNYVFVFYRAMIIFAKKHFNKGQASLFGILIYGAIYFRATLAILRRLFGKVWPLGVDWIFAFVTFFAATHWYERYAHKNFDLPYLTYSVAAYASITTLVLLYSGVYDRGYKALKLVRGWLAVILVLLGFYALLPEAYRYSRAVLLIGAALSLPVGLTWRFILQKFKHNRFTKQITASERVLIVSQESGFEEIVSFLKHNKISPEFYAGAYPENKDHYPIGFISDAQSLQHAIEDFKIDTIIFDTRVVSNKWMINKMNDLKAFNISFKMALGHPLFILGSQDIVEDNDMLVAGDLTGISLDSVKRLKRTFDILVTIIMLPFIPLLLFLVDNPIGLIKNTCGVLVGNFTWVGLDPRGFHRTLPSIKPGVIYPMLNVIIHKSVSKQLLAQNLNYLKQYQILTDLPIMLKHLHALGNRQHRLDEKHA